MRETAVASPTDSFIRTISQAELQAKGCAVVQVNGHTLAIFGQDDKVYAVDNRCPHMGFPLDRGDVQDGILTCHWHHARFDLASGGTFDPWADDVRTFPVQIRDGAIWVDLAPRADLRAHQRKRLHEGLEHNIPLVIAKSVLALLDGGEEPVSAFRVGLDFGARYRPGWGQGLTMHTCFMNLIPWLDPEDRSRALYHGLSAVAHDCQGKPPRFGIQPLPTLAADFPTLKRWFRQFVEVRDAEGAERCLASAVCGGAEVTQLTDMLFAAATDHRYIQAGHVADFTNKALEALAWAGWEHAEAAVGSLAFAYANAERMEESNAWRKPADLVAMLQQTFELLPAAMETGARVSAPSWAGGNELVSVLLGDNPQGIADSMLEALRDGAKPKDLAAAVVSAAALRIARFHTSNEFSDWDRALHTFTFANAVDQAIRRVPSPEILRGVFDAAISVYLDRFLNVPSAAMPEPDDKADAPETIIRELPAILDQRQQVNVAGELVTRYLYSGGNPQRLLAMLGGMLLREDRDFHTVQMVEAAFRQYSIRQGSPEGVHILVAAARYVAAHSPTVRAQGQTYQIARRLHGGARLFEET